MTDDEIKNAMAARYASGKLEVVVAKCSDCPFFGTTLMSMLANIGNPDGNHAGDCKAPVAKIGGGILLGKHLPVKDSRETPKWCPLRLGDVVVTVAD